MKTSISARLLVLGLAALAICALTGCSTVSDPYSFVVKTERNLPPPSEATGYLLVYSDANTRALVEPFQERIGAGLAQRGYESAPIDEATELIYVYALREQVVLRTQEVQVLNSSTSQNPDSVRYKNVAAMIGGGRYPELLNDNSSAPGGVVVGPNGEWIATGNLRGVEKPPPASEEKVYRKVSGLVLTGVSAALPQRAEQAEIRWRVEIFSEQELDQPAPDIKRMVELALDHMETSTKGRAKRIKSKSS